MSGQTISFGWGAPSFAEQFPILPAAAAKTADKISQAITLLAVHGIITRAERDRAFQRATRRIESDLRKAMEAANADA